MFHPGFHHDFFWWIFPSFGTLLWLAFLVLVISALFWAFRHRLPMSNTPFVGYRPTPPPYQPSAMEILRQRYARGEIDEVTFQQMRERLEATLTPQQQ